MFLFLPIREKTDGSADKNSFSVCFLFGMVIMFNVLPFFDE